MTLCYGMCCKMLIMCILRLLQVTRIVMSIFAFVATARISLRVAAIPDHSTVFASAWEKSGKNSPLFLVGQEELAKPAFQMEELLLFYSFPCREPTVPRYAARWERSAS